MSIWQSIMPIAQQQVFFFFNCFQNPSPVHDKFLKCQKQSIHRTVANRNHYRGMMGVCLIDSHSRHQCQKTVTNSPSPPSCSSSVHHINPGSKTQVWGRLSSAGGSPGQALTVTYYRPAFTTVAIVKPLSSCVPNQIQIVTFLIWCSQEHGIWDRLWGDREKQSSVNTYFNDTYLDFNNRSLSQYHSASATFLIQRVKSFWT